MNLAELRREYAAAALDEAHSAIDPIEQFALWFNDARTAGVVEPNAMTLATATPDGAPSARIVLLKGFSHSGFVFYTDHRSRKGRELIANPRAAAVFHWVDLERQVRVTGAVAQVDRTTSEAYFRTRPHDSQLGAWSSEQSAVIADRAALESALERRVREFAGRDVPLPPHWGGFLIAPHEIEFWQGRPGRLHDRLRYTRSSEHAWDRVRLSP